MELNQAKGICHNAAWQGFALPRFCGPLSSFSLSFTLRMGLGPLCPEGALIFFQYLDEIYIFHKAKVLIINVYALFHKQTCINVLINENTLCPTEVNCSSYWWLMWLGKSILWINFCWVGTVMCHRVCSLIFCFLPSICSISALLI